MKRRTRSLHLRIMAWSFVPTAVILFAVALLTVLAYQHVTEDLVIGRNRELTRLSAVQLSSDMGEYTSLLVSLVRSVDRRHHDHAALQALLTDAGNRLVVFDAGTVLLDSAGIVVAAQPARPELLGRDLSSRSYFRQLLRTAAPAFSDIVADGPGGIEVMVLAVPVTGDQGEFHGVLAGMFRLGASEVSAFYSGIVKLRIGQNGNTYLVDSTGRAIFHPDPARIGQDLSAQPSVQAVLKRQVGYLRGRDLEGRGVLVTYAPVPNIPWGLVSEENWSALLAASGNYSRLYYLLLGLGVVLPAIVVTFGVQRIMVPISSLITAAQEVASGNLSQRIVVNTGDELEELAEQFNRMSAQLRESYAQLERRVADRTRELATLNAIAGVVNRSLDLDEIMQDALDKTTEVMGMDMGAAFRYDEDSGELALMTCTTVAAELAEASIEASRAATAEDRQAAMRPSVRSVASYPEGRLRRLLQEHGVAVVVNVPLVAKGRLLGLIKLGSATPRDLTTEELTLLGAIGQQIGVAMENARLYGHAEQAAAATERNRLARDLHDAVSQTLFSATLIAEVLPRLWERNPQEGQRRLAELRQLTRGALAEMRTLLLELRPSALTEAPLSDLLRQLGEAVTGRSRVPVTVRTEGERALTADVQLALYRIAQEALNNVAKHSGATQATVDLHCQAWGVALEVQDNGCGFDPECVGGTHLGLNIMRERAQGIGARLSVESEPGEGTRVVVIWRDTSA
ncbi:MAG: cache domain-containing protein [Anaerolineae bacterium]